MPLSNGSLDDSSRFVSEIRLDSLKIFSSVRY